MSALLQPGERLFMAYLRQRRLRYEYEPIVGGRRPDFVVEHPGIGQVAWEVYEPEHRLPGRVGAVDPYPPIRSAFEGRKRKQAKASSAAGLPHVVVLGGSNSDVSFDPLIVAGGMFGNVGVTFSVQVDPDGPPPPDDRRTSFLGGGRLQPELNRSVSAVAILTSFNPTLWRVHAAYRSRLDQLGLHGAGKSARDREARVKVIMETFEHFTCTGMYDDEARVARVTVLHNPHAAHPLDLGVVSGPHDEQWGVVVDTDEASYGQVASGIRCWELPRHD